MDANVRNLEMSRGVYRRVEDRRSSARLYKTFFWGVGGRAGGRVSEQAHFGKGNMICGLQEVKEG